MITWVQMDVAANMFSATAGKASTTESILDVLISYQSLVQYKEHGHKNKMSGISHGHHVGILMVGN
jgi:hypothetical protein